MSLAHRFRSLDLGEPLDDPRVGLRTAVRAHQRHRAMQEAINRSGVCTPGALCGCLNCREHAQFWQAVRAIMREDGLNQSEARRVIGRTWTRGAASTPWQDAGLRMFGYRLPSDSKRLDEAPPEDYFRLTHQPIGD